MLLVNIDSYLIYEEGRGGFVFFLINDNVLSHFIYFKFVGLNMENTLIQAV